MNNLIFGDCLEEMKGLADKSIDMILCDLPYGTTQNKWDSVIDLELLWKEYLRVAKDNAAIVLTAQTPFDKVLGVSNLKMLRYEWIWEKPSATGHLNAKKMPMKAHENVLVFYKKPPTYNPQITTGHVRKVSTAIHGRNSTKSNNYGMFQRSDYSSTSRYPRSVQIFGKDVQKSALHPTQKPVSLFEYLIRTYTNEGDIILDNCAGSGTTAIACLKTKRQYVLIENDPIYMDVIKERITKHITEPKGENYE